MDAQTRSMLNDTEQELLRATTASKLARLDEDALLDLHSRVRRARTKYVTLHRRRGAAQVRKDRSRTRSGGAVSPAAVKAEAFEEALGRVSARLAKVAAAAADALKRERLATAAKTSGKPKAARAAAKQPARGGGAPRARARTPIEQKRNASSRAAKSRTQTRGDARR